MLNKIKDIQGYKLHSKNGEIGTIKEFYFDDQYWVIRYLVAETGNWLMERQVLLSPYSLLALDPQERHIDVDLTKEQIEKSPPLDTDKPVSRQFEEAYYGYYGWPSYWNGPYSWGTYPNLIASQKKPSNHKRSYKTWDPNLRSTRDVTGHQLQALDGDIGHVEDFILDDETWSIRYLVVNTKNWWPGKKVLISSHWIDRISWNESAVFVNLTREQIQQSPEYTDKSLLNREYEIKLHNHYQLVGYWIKEPDLLMHNPKVIHKESWTVEL